MPIIHLPYRPLVLLTLLLAFSQCGGGPQSAASAPKDNDALTSTARAQVSLSSDEPSYAPSKPCLNIPEKAERPPASASATFIDTSFLRDSLLTIAFHYSGCQKGSYQLFRQSPSAQGKRSFPLSLLLTVQEAGLCDMLLRDTTCIDLSRLPYRGPEVQVNLNRGQAQHLYRP